MTITLLAALVFASVVPAPSAGTSRAWREHRIARLGAAFDLPASWRDLSRRTPAVERSLRAVERTNPSLAPYIRSLRATGAIAFIAADLDRSSLQRGFVTNVNVIHQRYSGAPLASVRRALVAQLRNVAPVRGAITTRLVRTRSGQALELRYVIRTVVAGRAVRSAATQFVVSRNRRLFILTYSTHPADSARYRAVFERSGRSFRFG